MDSGVSNSECTLEQTGSVSGSETARGSADSIASLFFFFLFLVWPPRRLSSTASHSPHLPLSAGVCERACLCVADVRETVSETAVFAAPLPSTTVPAVVDQRAANDPNRVAVAAFLHALPL
jgi:hypothetical protein